jgi:hypothetical protein
LTERQRTRQGIVWILKAAEKGRKGGVPRETRIAKEVLAVLEGNSDVFKWLEEKHKVATANRYVWALMVNGQEADDKIEPQLPKITDGRGDRVTIVYQACVRLRSFLSAVILYGIPHMHDFTIDHVLCQTS